MTRLCYVLVFLMIASVPPAGARELDDTLADQPTSIPFSSTDPYAARLLDGCMSQPETQWLILGYGPAAAHLFPSVAIEGGEWCCACSPIASNKIPGCVAKKAPCCCKGAIHPSGEFGCTCTNGKACEASFNA